MSSYLERLEMDQRFAGKGLNDLERIKRLRDDGWDVTVLICYKRDRAGKVRATGEVLVLGWRDS